MPSLRYLCLKIPAKHLVSEMDLHILPFLVHSISHIVYLTQDDEEISEIPMGSKQYCLSQ